MELKQLEYFVACADIGSFTKAAELLYVNQSSVSRAVQALEDGWETTLFLRSKRGITLTIEGDYYYQKVCQLLQDLHGLREQYAVKNRKYFTVTSFPSNYITYCYARLYMENRDSGMVFQQLGDRIADIGFIPASSEPSDHDPGRLLAQMGSPCVYMGIWRLPRGWIPRSLLRGIPLIRQSCSMISYQGIWNGKDSAIRRSVTRRHVFM